MNLETQLAQAKVGKYVDDDGDNSCHNFHDWFCRDTSLKAKAGLLFRQVQKFVDKHPDIDQKSTYVFFKNNCPLNGVLYDSFSICDLESREVLFWATNKSGFQVDSDKKARVFKAPNFTDPLYIGDSLSKILKNIK
jgi:hypothetical protein